MNVFHNCADQEGVTLTCGQAESGTVSGCWAVVVAPYIAEGKKRLQASFAFTMPDTTGLSKPADVALVWGLAHDGNSPWHEPPPGWSTEPPVSWDIAHGAWGALPPPALSRLRAAPIISQSVWAQPCSISIVCLMRSDELR